MSLPIKRIITQQPQVNTKLDPSSSLGKVLEYAWVGNSLYCKDIVSGLVNPLYIPFSLQPTTKGLCISSNGSAGIATVVLPKPLTSYPLFIIGYGFFSSTGGNWQLANAVVSSGGYLLALRVSSDTQVEFNVRFNFGTHQVITITLPTITNTPICMIGQVFSATDYRFYANGIKATATTSLGTYATPFNQVNNINANLNGGVYFTGYGNGLSLTDNEAIEITRDPSKIWQAFQPAELPIFSVFPISAITLTSASDSTDQTSATAVITTGVYTASDMSTTGWTGSPDNVVLANNINEELSDTAQYIQSPAITGSQGPADFDLNNYLGVGTWEVDVTFKYTLSAASVKFTLLNAGGTSVGDSGWIAASSVFAGYTPTITISSGTATKLRVEVQ